MRTRAAILIQNHALALIERHRDGMRYFTFPGGGAEVAALASGTVGYL